MHLQDAGGDLRRDRAEERLLDDVGLALAVGDHQDLAGLHDGLDAHGVGLLGDQVGVAVEEALVGLNGLLFQVNAVGAQLEGLVRLVEADVAVVADAQQLQVHAADTVDDGVIAGALGRSVEVRAIGQVDGLGADVHMVKQVAVHKAPIALGVLLRQAAVLVQIDGRDLGEVNIALVVPLDQLLVGAHGGAAGSQAQHAVGLHDDLGRNDVGGLAGHIVVIFCADDLHKTIPPVFSGRVAPVLLSSLYHAAGGIL